MHPMLNIAVRAARQAGTIIVRSLNRLDTLNVTEKAANDYVSEVDTLAERAILQTIQKAYPQHAFLAEESGQTGESDFVWVIDPLDGTTNFLRGISQFAVSIALLHKGQLDQAVVYDPVKDELFCASRGNGATFNGRRMRVTPRRNLKGALLGTGIPFRQDQDLALYLKTMGALLPDTAGVRRPGSAALDLAYVACGRFDGFWEFGLNPWDMAAGALLVLEAGGYVSEPNGGKDFMDSGNVLAAGPKVHAEMLARLDGLV